MRCPQSVQQLTTSSGSIQSLYLEGYPNNMICTWLIINPNSNFIAFKFTFVDLETGRNCQYDYVEVREVNSVNSPLLGKFCGSTVPSLLMSSSRYLWIRFHTDSSTSRKGFMASSVSRSSTATDSTPWNHWTTNGPIEKGTENVESEYLE